MNFKKIIFFLCFSFLFISPCKAITPTVEYQEGFYSNRIGPDKTYSGKMGFLVVDDKVVFCLEPYKIIGGNYDIDNNYFNNYNEDDLNYIKLVSNYVDKFIQKRDIYYYMAAQELIWERLYGKDTVSFTTEKNSAGSVINLEDYKREIEIYVNNILLKPSFEGTIIKDNFYSVVELEDTNGVLQQYDIVNDSPNMVWKEGNKLYIKILSSKLADIKFVRKEGNGTPIYYHSPTNQDLATLNSYVETISYLNVQSNNEYSEDININFLSKKFGSLITDAVTFQIVNSDNNKVIVENETYNGIYYVNLKVGNYELKINKVLKNYLIPESITFSIKEEDYLDERSILVYIDEAIGKVNVNSYKDSGLYQLYLDRGYEERLINTFNDTKSFDLDLGNYYIIDITTGKKYDINLEYKDAFTPIIVYDLDIYPDKDVDQNEEIREDTILKEEINMDESEEENQQTQNDDSKEDKQSDELEEKVNLNSKKEDKVILEDDNTVKEIDKNDTSTNNIEIVNNIDNQLIPNSQDNVVYDLENIKTLPNTFNYIKTVKHYLFVILLLGIIVKFKKNEKE